MNETSGVLRPAVTAYLNGEAMTPEQIAAMRAYLRQWIAGPWGPEPEVEQLRRDVDKLTTRTAIRHWLDRAERWNIDPL